MKIKHVFLTILIVLLLDQVSKVYVKTHFSYNEEIDMIGNWFKLHFLENEGMAFGMKFGGDWGKLVLTVFRILACIWGVYFIQTTLIKGKYHNGLIFCASLILAGAIGNSIDSIFYGKIFSESYHSASQLVPWGQGYGELFHGKVVDMLYFPVLTGTFPSWVPIWGGEPFEFFRPVFNIADASISSGVISIFVFQTIFFKSKEEVFITETEENKHAEDVDPLILSEDTELES